MTESGALPVTVESLAEPGGIEELPALVDARRHVLRAVQGQRRPAEVAAILEADPALLFRTLRDANALAGRARSIGTAEQAVAALGPEGVRALAERVPIHDPLKRGGAWGSAPQGYLAHVSAVRSVAEQLVRGSGIERPAELVAAVVLHDIGRLALQRAEPGYQRLVPADAVPEERVAAERSALGIDHAALGGWLARRWLLPERIATAVEDHHQDRLGLGALVRLADLLVHAREGRPVDLAQLATTAAVAGVATSTLRAAVFAADDTGRDGRITREPCPLTARELEVLQALSDGRVPKEIALALNLAENTVRSHLHRIYRRLDVADRTQAVLMARERGWI